MIDCSHGQFLLLSLPGSPELGSKLGPGQEKCLEKIHNDAVSRYPLVSGPGLQLHVTRGSHNRRLSAQKLRHFARAKIKQILLDNHTVCGENVSEWLEVDINEHENICQFFKSLMGC